MDVAFDVTPRHIYEHPMDQNTDFDREDVFRSLLAAPRAFPLQTLNHIIFLHIFKKYKSRSLAV